MEDIFLKNVRLLATGYEMRNTLFRLKITNIDLFTFNLLMDEYLIKEPYFP